MRRTLLTIIVWSLMSVSAIAHTYVASSALSSGNIVKLQIPATGIYSLTYEQIQAMGINPKTVRVLGYGGALIKQNFTLRHVDDVPSIPFYMYTGADGVFSNGDYILFYAQGPVGWDWSGAYYKRTRNYYADYGCYFLSDDAGQQRLLNTPQSIEEGDAYNVYTYTSLQLYEKEERNLLDVSKGEEGGGREWYGDILTPENAKLTVPFTCKDADKTQPMICRVDAAASASVVSYLTISVAEINHLDSFARLETGDNYTVAKTRTSLITNAIPNAESLPVTLQYSSSNISSKAYVNFIEMQVPCFMHLRDKFLMIRNTEHVGENLPSRYHLVGANSQTQIWNMTHPDSAFVVATSWHEDTLCWLGSNLEPQLFIAINPNATGWDTPASRGKITNQDLHKRLRGVQHVIVSPEAFMDQAERLKQAHEQQTPDQHWAVVSDEQVYNEFSSGTPDASAIRWMMKYLYDSFQNTSDAPQSVLLFGDGTFDNRKILPNSGTPTLLTYQAFNSTIETNAYATDDYFGWMEDNAGVIGTSWDDRVAKMQISVGRLPVNTYEQAQQVVDKLVAYMSNINPSAWKEQLCFLADDGNSGMHVTTADLAAQLVRSEAPEYIQNKIYLDAYEQTTTASGESYPLALNTYTNLLQSGVMLMDYAGHGSANNICSEMFLTRKQVETMTNANQGVWMLATCNFAHFDMKEESTAEVAVLNPVGGAIAVISADRTVFASENEILNMYFCENLFAKDSTGQHPYTIGEALRLAKNRNGVSMNKLAFVLLGDPALRLNYPTHYPIELTSVPDTLHALDLVTIKGRIPAQYDGTLTITVYDKQQTVATKDNDETDPQRKVIRYFKDFPNKLFMGESYVKDGEFTVQFRMPKDIRYNVGLGRIALYATGEDPMGEAEAIGYCETFRVGGSSPWVIDDNEGPDMQLYLNSPQFKSGDAVNPTPHFYAELYDKNGINTVGSGIGHDLLLVVDNQMKQSYTLNNYYAAEINSYQSGLVSYIMPQMQDGDHSLSFRAWDMLNNATTKTIGFSINSDLGPEVKKMYVYPNPVNHTGELNMYLMVDRPDDVLTMSITFYDLAGHAVWSSNYSLFNEHITIDMSQTNMPTGLYIYQFRIQTSTQSSSHYTGRLIVY